MNSSRRTFLRTAVASTLIVGAWGILESEAGRIEFRSRPVACCVPNSAPGQSYTHPPFLPKLNEVRT